jgi:hypothetical protein
MIKRGKNSSRQPVAKIDIYAGSRVSFLSFCHGWRDAVAAATRIRKINGT